MGNGVLFNQCCNKHDNNAKDVDINKINRRIQLIKKLFNSNNLYYLNHYIIFKTKITYY